VTAATSSTLSEAESKAVLARYGIPFPREDLAPDAVAAGAAAERLGFPVVVKLNGDGIAHKTERGLVRLRLTDRAAVEQAASELLAKATPEDGPVEVLVAQMLQGNRELIAGVAQDPQFGPTVVLGVGGVLAEALADVSIRLAPLTASDALEMLDDLRTQALLGPFRGEPAVDRDAVVTVLLALADAAMDPEIRSVDLNPLIVVDGRPVAVDALVELASA